MNLSPIRDRILVRPSEAEKQTTLGIIIPDNAQEKPMFGSVISTGSGKVAENGVIIALDVAAGDRIIYNRNAGIPVRVNNEELLILTEQDILAIVKE